MKVLFMGTPDIATGCLQKLIDEKYEIIGVVTQPDKPQNRGKKLGMPPVKELALKYDITSFSQRWQLNRNRVKTVVQVLSERSILDCLLHIQISGGDDADISFNRFGRTDA